jgi:hypothetical protein
MVKLVSLTYSPILWRMASYILERSYLGWLHFLFQEVNFNDRQFTPESRHHISVDLGMAAFN